MADFKSSSGTVGTVYNGPDIDPDGTVYSVAPRSASAGGTVFDESTFVPKKQNYSVTRTAVTGTIRKASVRFFIYSAVSLLEFFVFYGANMLAAGMAMASFLVFLVIGIFAYRLSRVAFLAALALYGLGTLMIAIFAFTSDLGVLFYCRVLVVRCIVFYNILQQYNLLNELHALENN